jgi:hypothetical protein
MDSEGLCWVCSSPLLKGERVTRLSSLGLEVHARCADAVLGDGPPPDDEDDEAEGPFGSFDFPSA